MKKTFKRMVIVMMTAMLIFAIVPESTVVEAKSRVVESLSKSAKKLRKYKTKKQREKYVRKQIEKSIKYSEKKGKYYIVLDEKVFDDLGVEFTLKETPKIVGIEDLEGLTIVEVETVLKGNK